MGALSPTHLIILLVIVLLIFGTKKLRNIGSDLGGAVKGFKDGMKTDEDKKAEQLTAEKTGQTVEGEIKDKQKS